MLKSLLVGALLTIITVGIHAAGTTWWIRRLVRLRTKRSWPQWRVLYLTAVLLLMLHLLEVIVWGATYLLLPQLVALHSLEEAIYFSMVTFSSLGYGDLVLDGSWRLLSGIQAMTGVLIFGWSTALFIAVVQRLWNRAEVAVVDES
jgi:hypothetical protein